jgi:hypothetical protein
MHCTPVQNKPVGHSHNLVAGFTDWPPGQFWQFLYYLL